MPEVHVLPGGSPQPIGGITSADQVTVFGDGTHGHPFTLDGGTAGGGDKFTAQAHSAVTAGQLLQMAFATGDKPVQPLAAPATSAFVGMATVDAASGDFLVQENGIITLTTAQWDAVAGTTGGLNRQTVYYASRTTPGSITSVAPTSGQAQVVAGIALNTTQLLLIGGPRTIIA